MTKRRVLIGSGNAHKIRELKTLLERIGIEAVTLDELAEPPPEPEETADTFEGNARAKALEYARATGLWTLADDSGLEVEALGGRPGVRSARYSGPEASDGSNNAKLQAEMANVPDDQRAARYVAVVALASPERILALARGECAGTILREPRGDAGFGYDPLFLVPDRERTFAELGHEVKSRISHRAQALERLEAELSRLLG